MTTQSLIWVRCSRLSQTYDVDTLAGRLAQDGEDLRFELTFTDPVKGQRPHPPPSRGLKTYLTERRPVACLWLDEVLDPATLQACSDAGVPVIIVNATVTMARAVGGIWLAGRRRSMLKSVAAVLCVNPAAKDAFRKVGFSAERLLDTGRLEDSAPLLPYNEADRQALAQAIGTRPVWLAAGVTFEEVTALAEAHREASRTAHRLMLIVSPVNLADGAAFGDAMRAAGYATAVRSQNEDFDTHTQVYIADLADELGLWLRIAPITYVGSSLRAGASFDPFTAAALGSAVVHGQRLGRFGDRFQRLQAAHATLAVQTADALGPAIATLLAVDKAAALAHAGWDVTTRGASAADAVLRAVRGVLDDGAP